MGTKQVTIKITSKQVGTYEARSYPIDSRSDPSMIELYRVPLYEIGVIGTDDDGTPSNFPFKAPRFMPFWNDPANPSRHYSAKGWINSGLAHSRRIVVTRYLDHYAVQNRYSPGRGAIVLLGSFYIHAGPAEESNFGFGSAGCVEIVGDFDVFKETIAGLSGSRSPADNAIQELIRDQHLIVNIEGAKTPDIKSSFTRKVARQELFPDTR